VRKSQAAIGFCLCFVLGFAKSRCADLSMTLALWRFAIQAAGLVKLAQRVSLLILKLSGDKYAHAKAIDKCWGSVQFVA